MIDVKTNILKQGWKLEDLANQFDYDVKLLESQLDNDEVPLWLLKRIAYTIGIELNELLEDGEVAILNRFNCPHCGKLITMNISFE